MIFAGASFAVAEPADAATELGTLVQSFYDQTKAFEADFKQKQYTRVYKKTTKAKGKVIFAKPGKMRWDYSDPAGQVLVADGDKLSLYEPPDEGEKAGQLIERSIDQGQLPGVFGFLMGTGKIVEDFKLRILPQKKGVPASVKVLELIPKTPSPHFDKLYFYARVIEKSGKKAAVVRRVLIVDAQGNRNQFDMSNMKFLKKVDAKRFKFVAPKGTHKVSS